VIEAGDLSEFERTSATRSRALPHMMKKLALAGD
jgi:hypothetical protein